MSDLIEQILRKVEYIPPPPASLARTLALIDAPDASMEIILDQVRYDSALSANILKICNSAHYGMGRNVESLKDALSIVGLSELRRMILFIMSKQVFNRVYPGYEGRVGELWRHSMATAVVASNLQPYASNMEGDLFTTALLHDVGKMVMSEYVREEVDKILALVREKKISFIEAELEVIGMNHAEVGARILEHWKFPDEVVKAVRYHHNPMAVDSVLTHFVAIANVIALMMGYSTDTDGLSTRFHPTLYGKYNLDEVAIQMVMMSSLPKIQEVEKSMP